MPRPSIWTKEHIDFLESLVRQNLNSQDMATRMSRQFHVRVTMPFQVNTLIVRMRTPSGPALPRSARIGAKGGIIQRLLSLWVHHHKRQRNCRSHRDRLLNRGRTYHAAGSRDGTAAAHGPMQEQPNIGLPMRACSVRSSLSAPSIDLRRSSSSNMSQSTFSVAGLVTHLNAMQRGGRWSGFFGGKIP